MARALNFSRKSCVNFTLYRNLTRSRRVLRRFSLGLGEDDEDLASQINVIPDEPDLVFPQFEEEEEIDTSIQKKITVDEIVRTMGLNPYDQTSQVYEEQRKRHNIMTFEELREWNRNHEVSGFDDEDDEADSELEEEDFELMDSAELEGEGAMLSEGESASESESEEDFDLQSDELENLRQFWTNTRRHERLHDNEDVSGMFRDLDLQLSQLKKPSSFMAPLANVPNTPETDNTHLTVDEMEDLGVLFEQYETSDVTEKPAIELDEGTWEALHVNINPRRWDLKTYYLTDRGQYDIGEFDDPPKPYPKPYVHNEEWRVSFPINEIIMFLRHERARSIRVYDVTKSKVLAAQLKDWIIFCEGVHPMHSKALLLKLEKAAKGLGAFDDPYFLPWSPKAGTRSEMSDLWGCLDLGDTMVVVLTPEGKEDEGLQEMELEYEDYLYGIYGPSQVEYEVTDS